MGLVEVVVKGLGFNCYVWKWVAISVSNGIVAYVEWRWGGLTALAARVGAKIELVSVVPTDFDSNASIVLFVECRKLFLFYLSSSYKYYYIYAYNNFYFSFSLQVSTSHFIYSNKLYFCK